MENAQPPKRKLTLTLNVIENRDSSFGSSKNVPLAGCCCCSTTTCCCWGGGGGGNGGTVDVPESSE